MVYTNNVPCGSYRAPGQPQVVFAVECHTDMIAREMGLGKGGDRDLGVDVFRPGGQSGLVPGVLFFPGGGWRNCDRSALAERYGYPIAERGYVCINGEYRVTI